MSPINNNSSVLSIRVESTEGVPALVSASGDFVALQPGFALVPETDLLANEEIRSSIARAPSKPGLERVTGSFNHYIRHSGVEGQAPNWGIILESLLGGKAVEATEHALISGSTTTLLKYGVGVGASKRIGQAVLVKDATNGRSVRNISSISSDDASLNFKLANAPANGTNTGKNVGYYGVDTGHKSLTLDLFRGNSGAREVGSGMKCTQGTLEWNAAEYFNGSFSFQGRKYHFDAIEITATTKYLDFNDGGDKTVIVPEGVYRDPYELAEAIESLLNDASALTFVVSWNDYGTNKGKFTISASANFSLEWNTGANTANTIGTKLGFSVAADDTGTDTYTSDNAQSWASTITPAYDDADPLVAKAVDLFIGDQDESYNVCAKSFSADLANEVVERLCASSETGLDSVGFTGRDVTVTLTATLEPHEARYFAKYRNNDNIGLMLNIGEKLGGQWKEGTVVNFYIRTGKITAIQVGDENGDAILNMTITAHVESGQNSEVFLNCI